MRPSFILGILLLPYLSFSQQTKTDYDYYENSQVHWKGELLLKDNAYSPIGLWRYWHEDGKLKLQTWDDTNSKTKYINMWLPTGEQILENGQGFMYEVWPGGDQEADSTVYEVKDSIKQGYAKVYRLYKGGTYFLVMEGQLDRISLRTGKWVYRDTIHGNAFETYYIENKKSGPYKRFYLTGQLREVGQNANDKEEGDWKYFDPKGTLIKECSYKAGNLIGLFREYYDNRQLKVEGAYRQGEGTIKVGARSAGSGKSRVYNKKILNKEYKTGKWTYYNSNGKIIKKEQYK
jgi:antitoxin component YwqK of YwqJK toxin-antitoxin module